MSMFRSLGLHHGPWYVENNKKNPLNPPPRIRSENWLQIQTDGFFPRDSFRFTCWENERWVHVGSQQRLCMSYTLPGSCKTPGFCFFASGKIYSSIQIMGIILKPLGFPHVLAVFWQGPNMYAYHVWLQPCQTSKSFHENSGQEVAQVPQRSVRDSWRKQVWQSNNRRHGPKN